MLTALPAGVVNDRQSFTPQRQSLWKFVFLWVPCLSIHNKGSYLSSLVFKNYRLGMQAHLALCCKALLPILGMGHVRVNLGTPGSGTHLLNATRYLTKQPDGVSHLDVHSLEDNEGPERPGTGHLIDLRCADACMWCWSVQGVAPALLCHGHVAQGMGPVPMLLCASAAC